MSTSAAPPADAGAFYALDNSRVAKAQLKIMFISGVGFFTDAYDLFVIGIVVSLLKPEWNLSTSQVSWVNSSTLLASAVGAGVFGRVADILGRKRIDGYEVLILAIGALASAFAPNYVFLLVCRIVLGQAGPRQDGRARVRHAGRGPHLRAAARLRRGPRNGLVLPAPAHQRDAAIRDGGRRRRRG